MQGFVNIKQGVLYMVNLIIYKEVMIYDFEMHFKISTWLKRIIHASVHFQQRQQEG